jgi:phage terminase large subunit-like protein
MGAAKGSKRAKKAPPAFWYDPEAAERPILFAEKYCRHIKGELAGQTIRLEEWQKRFIREAFGWKKPDGTRKYRTIYLEVPRKNAKSTLACALGLYLLTADGEPGAEIYSAAGDREQARVVFDVASEMVRSSPQMARRARVYKNSIVYNSSFYKVISAEAYSKHGFNAHGIILDELHVQPNSELYDVLTTSVGARRQPMVIILTTAGVINTFAEKISRYAANVRDGVIVDESWLSVIYGAGPKADPFSPEVWAEAKEQAERARNEPSFLNTFRRLHLNIWTGSVEAWIADNDWQESQGPQVALEDLAGRECWAGLDLASTKDLSCFSRVFPDPSGGVAVLPYFFVPEGTAIYKARSENSSYLQWIEEGAILATPGDVQDYAFIKAVILEACQRYRVKGVAFDAWNSSQLVTELVDAGVNMIPYRQGWASMSTPTKELEKMVLKKLVNHYKNPVLRWQLGNVAIQKDPAGNIKIAKDKSKDKVDGMVATVMGLGAYLAAIATAPKPVKSMYENPDLDLVLL